MTDFVCEIDERYHSACEGLPFYAEHEGKRYCVLHHPGEGKKDDFNKVLESKLAQKDYDFSGSVFPTGTSDFQGFEFEASVSFKGVTFVGEADFTEAQFGGEATSFERAKFSGVRTEFTAAEFGSETTDFSFAEFSGKKTSFSATEFSSVRTDFSSAKFSAEDTYFRYAKFCGVRTEFTAAEFGSETTDFSFAEFSGKESYFLLAKFSGELANFAWTTFDSAQTYFMQTSFTKDVNFTNTAFRQQVFFWGTQGNPVFGTRTWAKFERCRIEEPELLAFNTVLLRPGWFINADVRKVDFTDVKWYGMPGGPIGTVDDEIDALKERDVASPYALLSQACQRLATNAEMNREYPLANEFHYWSMDVQRKGIPGSALAPWKLIWWYWALSGYGERQMRAGMWLLGILIGFGALYMWVGPMRIEKHSLAGILQAAPEALVYSLGVMTRLASDIPKSASALVTSLIIIEGVLGPLQIGLFLLALRRKFMR